jgi:hypothetical protein
VLKQPSRPLFIHPANSHLLNSFILSKFHNLTKQIILISMKHIRNNRFLPCLLAAAASCSSLAQGATPATSPNSGLSYSDSITALNDLPSDGVPTEIDAAITALANYKSLEEANKLSLEGALNTAQSDLSAASEVEATALTSLTSANSAFDLADSAFNVADDAFNLATTEFNTADSEAAPKIRPLSG